MHLGLSASLHLAPLANPGRSSAFGLRELFPRHGLAYGVFTRLDSFEHRDCGFSCKQVPHVSGNRGRCGGRGLSISSALDIIIVALNTFGLRLRKMFSHAELCRGIAGLGGFNDRSEWVFSVAAGPHGW